MHKWSQKFSLKETLFVKDNYKKLGTKAVANQLHKSIEQVRNCYSRLKRNNFQINAQYFARKPYKCPPLTPFELGYVTGFIDGEGSLTLDIRWDGSTPKHCYFMLLISNKDPRSIQFLHTTLRVPWKLYVSANGLTYLSFSGRQRVQELLKHIAPHLILKKGQAKVVLQLLDQHKLRQWTLKDWELVLKHSELNRADTHPSRIKRTAKLKRFIIKEQT